MKFATQSSTGLFLKKSAMDTRKVQMTGKSTFVVTLPKKWVVSSKLRAGEELGFSYQDNGSVLLIPPKFREEHLVKRISADRNFDFVERDITALYVLGSYNSIEIRGEAIDFEKRERIKVLCKNLIGYEIVESSPRKIIIQDLLNTEDINIEKVAIRMFSLVFLMFDDITNILNESRMLQGKEMAPRRIDLERTHTLVSRMYVEKMNIKKVSFKDNLSLVRAFYCRLAAENANHIGELLENIAFHTKNDYISKKSILEIEELCSFLRDMFRDSFESFKLADSVLANEVIERGTKLDSRIDAIRDTRNIIEEPRMEIILDAFGKLRDYNSNIAKLAIEVSHL
ncbi:hypothetical protein V7O62_03300 [Methanolobus sp. ZRKC2]|uniref:AbrB/MazE/SpoVT family DNA-binding domain-containing protein n=1 Tax=Methanolobus sp. ZRKC2 TaxID=3125783 RepID=UPI003251B402